MSQSSVVKTVGGTTTKITTMTRTSYSQQHIMQQQQRQQLQTNQQVITKPPFIQKEKHISVRNIYSSMSVLLFIDIFTIPTDEVELSEK